jgi:hypothetical protein
MRHQYRQPVDGFAPLAATQGFDLLGDVLEIDGVEVLLPQQGGLPGRPRVEITVIEICHAYLTHPTPSPNLYFSILQALHKPTAVERGRVRARLDNGGGHR